MRRIDEIYSYNKIPVFNTNKAVPLPSPAPWLLYGLELEIENCSPDWTTTGFQSTEDGSLRNDGWEFISRPMTYSNIAWCLQNFFDRNKPSDHNYSERTSIHVHTNVQNLNLGQLASLMMLYQVFEPVLFNFIGGDRDKNIFCVPWSETQMGYTSISRIKDEDFSTVRGWEKYTALNLLPIQEIGTVEWRHMYGNCNLDFILTWLRLIGHMFRVATTMDQDEVERMLVNLNSTSQYRGAIERVFEDEARWLMPPGVDLMLEESVINLKEALTKMPNMAQIIRQRQQLRPAPRPIEGLAARANDFANITLDDVQLDAMLRALQQPVAVNPVNQEREPF